MERKRKPKKNKNIAGVSQSKGGSRFRGSRRRTKDTGDVLGGLDYEIDLSGGLDSELADKDSEFESVPGDLEVKDEFEVPGEEFETEGEPREEDVYDSSDEKEVPEEELESVEVESTDDKSRVSERRATVRTKRSRARVSSRFPVGLIVLIVLAIATLIIAIMNTPFTSIDFSDLGFFLVLFTVAAHFDILLRGGGKVNAGMAVIIAAFLFLPRVEVVWIFLIGTLVTLVTKYMARWTKEELLGMLFDFVAVGVAACIYALLMNVLPDKPQLFGRYTPWELIAVALIGCLLFALFLAREAYIFSHEGKLPFAIYVKSAFRQSWIAYSLLVLTGLLMGMIARGIGLWYTLIAAPLLLLFVYTFNRVAKTDQYLLETIQVLSHIPAEIGIVPKGYIEDVASMTGEVARELGFAPEDVQQVEYAAYLHGIGAVTVNPSEMVRGSSEAEEAVLAGSVDILGKMEYLDVAAEILRGREGLSERVTDTQKRRTVSAGGGILQAVEDFIRLLRGSEDREPLGYNEAITEMNLERGSLYDSKVLRAIARISALPKEGSILTDAEGYAEGPSFWRRQED